MESNNINHLKEFNQEHLLEQLSSIENKEEYLKTIENIDYKLMNDLYKYYLSFNENKENIQKDKKIEPIEAIYSKNDFDKDELNCILNIGYENIAKGRVALLILAGGQGSRLGFDKAKGMFPVGLFSNKTIFEYLILRLKRITQLSAELTNSAFDVSKINILMLTSLENDKEIKEYIKANDFFGLKQNNFIIFPQDMIPAISSTGRILLKNEKEVFMNPNGNGGCLLALKKYKVLEQCINRGIEYIHIITQDNPLAKPLDPLFIGLSYYKKFSMAAKSIPKRDPHEKVGVFLKLNGKPEMMDYGDIPKSLCELRDEHGKLVYRASNMLNYLLKVETLYDVLYNEDNYQEIMKEFHIAQKKGQVYDPTEKQFINSDVVKFELFLNSIFHYVDTNGLLLLEVEREEEFAPIKNSNDSQNDTQNTCKAMMYILYRKWYEKAGGNVLYPDAKIEIDFSVSYDGENLENIIPKTLESDIFIKK